MRVRPSLARLRRFPGAREGVAAIEFAFIAPIMIFFYLGMAETCQLVMAQRRVSHSAAALADLVTQDTAIAASEMLEVFEAGCTLMDPFVVGNRKYRVRLTSARHAIPAGATAPTTHVAWSENNGRGFTDLADGSPIAPTTPLTTVGASVVIAEVEYDYKSSVNFLINTKTLKHRSEMRPRRAAEVAYTPPAAGAATTSMYCSN